jgi:hypothetical protein
MKVGSLSRGSFPYEERQCIDGTDVKLLGENGVEYAALSSLLEEAT